MESRSTLAEQFSCGGPFRARDVPVLLHEQYIWSGRMHGDSVNAVADLCIGIGEFVVGLNPAIDEAPCFAPVIGVEGASLKSAKTQAKNTEKEGEWNWEKMRTTKYAKYTKGEEEKILHGWTG